jgi:transcriptional regulator with XRE-family HTH domain
MFGTLLRRRRYELALTQEELAVRAGLTPRGVRDIETGKTVRPRPTTVRLLADALRLEGADRAAFCLASREAADVS